LNDPHWQDLVDLNRLARWMDERGLGAGPICSPILLTGGTQNILLKFTRSNREYVLRRPPRHLRANSNETMRREARILSALAGTDVPHPALIASHPDDDILGAAFFLMAAVDGFNATVALPPLHAAKPELRYAMGLALVDGLAALTRVDFRLVGLSDTGRPDGYLERQVDRWLGQLAGYAEYPGWPGSHEIEGVEEVAQWLRKHRPQSFTPGIVHGDYTFANVLFRRDSAELAAIVDWELSTIGDPLIDLGWLFATWPDQNGENPSSISVRPWDGFPTIVDLLQRYASSSNRDLSAMDWYANFGCFKLAIILEGTYARACDGKAAREVGARMHKAAIGLFRRALQRLDS
jgi:aminoglycoside phosphotransferase (APT) family kinase protein